MKSNIALAIKPIVGIRKRQGRDLNKALVHSDDFSY